MVLVFSLKAFAKPSRTQWVRLENCKIKEYLIQNTHVHCLDQWVLTVSFPLVYEKGFVKQNSSINRRLWGWGAMCGGVWYPFRWMQSKYFKFGKKKKLVLVIKIYFSWCLESLLINTRNFFYCSKQESADPWWWLTFHRLIHGVGDLCWSSFKMSKRSGPAFPQSS